MPKSVFEIAAEAERLRAALKRAGVEARPVIEPTGAASLYASTEILIVLAERAQAAAVLDQILAVVREQTDDVNLTAENLVDVIRRTLAVVPMIARTERQVELTEVSTASPAAPTLPNTSVTARQIELDLPPDEPDADDADVAPPPNGRRPALVKASEDRYAVGGTKLGPLIVVEGTVVSSGRR